MRLRAGAFLLYSEHRDSDVNKNTQFKTKTKTKTKEGKTETKIKTRNNKTKTDQDQDQDQDLTSLHRERVWWLQMLFFPLRKANSAPHLP